MDTSEPVTSPAREEPPAEESVLPSPPAIDAADDEVDYGGSPDADHRRAKPADDAEESAAGDGAAAGADGAPAASKGMIPGRKENGNGGANGDARTSSVVNGMRVCDVCSQLWHLTSHAQRDKSPPRRSSASGGHDHGAETSGRAELL